jgi:hypothetical protein
LTLLTKQDLADIREIAASADHAARWTCPQCEQSNPAGNGCCLRCGKAEGSSK